MQNVKDYIFEPKSQKFYTNVPFIGIKDMKKSSDLSQKRLVNTKHLMELLDCGKHTAIKIGNLANAKVCIERKLFWNVKLIQQYLDCIAE